MTLNEAGTVLDLMLVTDHTLFSETEKEAIRIAIKSINESKWISIKDQMPDKEGYYLVSGCGEVWICELLFLMGTKGWRNHAAKPCVEAWMPFPEPYNESW